MFDFLGFVQNAVDLSNTKTSFWILEAAAVDTDGTFTSGSYYLYITLTNLKTPPRFDNLPGTTDLLEDVTTAQQIFAVSTVNRA